MADDASEVEEGLTRPALKVVEPEIDPEHIWEGDKLDREKIAKRLTDIVEDQDAPFVISLDGRWGTGKTFLLKRWQAQLVEDGFEAIYFNAWEDDFCDDPLLAIIGQLSEHFGDGSFRDIAIKVANFGVGLLTKQLTGTAIDLNDFRPESLLEDYHAQRRSKQEMKDQISALAEQVRQETAKPLVFIIDELDRCRPTFAIELLERVKHIFDVPSNVFVFGINRAELVKSLRSVYGEIDADEYLRRFFDMAFVLPYADPAKFCKYLVDSYQIDSLFSYLSEQGDTRFHLEEFGTLSRTLPVILGHMGLSLRDMDYCIRVLSLAGRDLQNGRTVYPAVFALLAAVKISNPALYQRFVQGNARGAELLNYMNERYRAHGMEMHARESRMRHILDLVEVAVYCADDTGSVLRQLKHLRDGETPAQPEYLTAETAKLDANVPDDNRRLATMFKDMQNLSDFDLDYGESISYLVQLIDLYDSPVRR